MSNTEFATESKSSVAVTSNSKGDAQVAVKAYEGVNRHEMEALSDQAVAAYERTRRSLAALSIPVA